jgi:exo-1,4-beta-D-glucosaminidase
MFEAFIAHKPKSTGLIQWMLNSAWPELYWQLYDTYLQPNGSFYAVRKACNPIHAIYRYGFDDIYLANEDLQDAGNVTVKIRALDIHSRELFSDSWTGDIATNTSKFIYKLPEIDGRTSVWFLDLRVFDENNNEVDNSIYWLSQKPDVLDYEAAKKLEWPYYTPPKEYADFTALDRLPATELEYDYNFETDGDKGKVTLHVNNPNDDIAFFVFFDLINPVTEEPVLPIFWSDNYISLIPEEERTYTATFEMKDSNGGKPLLKIKAWTVEPVILE